MSSWLEAIQARDMGLLIAGRDFAGAQTMDEEYRQEIRWQTAFGHEGPVIRNMRKADQDTVSCSFIILRKGAAKGMINEAFVKDDLSPDFTITIRRGERRVVHTGVNWERISISSTADQSTGTIEMAVPGYRPPTGAGVTSDAGGVI